MKELKDKLIAALKKSAADLVVCGNIERMTDPAVKKLFPEAKTVICVAFRQLRGTRRGIEDGTVFYQYSTSVETLEEVIHAVQDAGGTAQQHWQEKMALALAEKMAIHAGKMLTEIEMRDLIMQLVEKHPAQYLSNGQTIISLLTQDEIQKRF